MVLPTPIRQTLQSTESDLFPQISFAFDVGRSLYTLRCMGCVYSFRIFFYFSKEIVISGYIPSVLCEGLINFVSNNKNSKL